MMGMIKTNEKIVWLLDCPNGSLKTTMNYEVEECEDPR